MDDEIADFFLFLLETTRKMHTSDTFNSNRSQLQQPDPLHPIDSQQQQLHQSQFLDGQQQQSDPSQSCDSQQQQSDPTQCSDGQQPPHPLQLLDDEPHVEQLISPFDPTTGICYYFTSHGGQLRQTPVYCMDGM